MIGRQYWFVIISRAMKNKLKFTDGTTLVAEGINDVLIKRMDGKHYLIKDVLYISKIKCNVLSIVKLLEKDYNIHMKNKALHVMDVNKVLVLKAHMDSNITSKDEWKVMEHKCLNISSCREEWIWYYRLGHLNFRDLNALQRNKMVMGLPLINIATKIYE